VERSGSSTNSRGILALGGTSEVKPHEPRDRVANFREEI